jgi:plasmid stabilization system protein ParE
MSSYQLTEQAEVDLHAIWDYIAADNIDAADSVAEEFRQTFQKLVQTPGMGHRRIDVRNRRFRFWTVYRYVIAYFPDTQPLQIIRVVGGEQDFSRLFRRQ